MTNLNSTLDLIGQLDPITLSIDQLYINPNNPRIMGKKRSKVLSDVRIVEEKIQKSVLEEMKADGLNDIIEKVKKMGFLPIDRIVVRKLRNASNKYLVLEGNRRASSLKILLKEHEDGIETLNKEKLNSIKTLQVLKYLGTDKNIEWLLQGIRHINGIKEWGPLQQARYLYEMQERKKLNHTELDKMTALGRTTIANRIRSYKGWLKAQDFYDGEIEEEHFSLFNEAIFARPKIKEWLGWEDSTGFKNEENLTLLLEWFIGDSNGKRRFTRALDLRDVMSKLLLQENNDILDKFLNEQDYSVDEVKYDLQKKTLELDARKSKLDINNKYEEIEKINATISTLPIPTITQNQQNIKNFIQILDELIKNSVFQKELLERYSDEKK